MQEFPSLAIIENLKMQFPKGCRVELISMVDPYSYMSSGTKGTVIGVDHIGTIHVNWDNGSSLGVAYGEDQCRKIEG